MGRTLGERCAPDDDLPLDQALERALMRQFTAEEIADRLHVPWEHVLRAAHERAELKGQPVDDTLRKWFRVLFVEPSPEPDGLSS
jgi:hypothetical protein